jgi:methionine aminotransferase
MQMGLADYLAHNTEHYLGLSKFYEAKRDTFIEMLQNSGFGITASSGTYFQMADYSQLSELDDTEFAKWLTIERGVAAIPISVFYAKPPKQKIVRFCFAKNHATLEQATEKLCRI